MAVVGIIAEFNPFHTGHKYLLDAAKRKGTVVCALSGNFVQRGDVAFLEKRKRAEAALLCGADLVVTLPVVFSMSTAQSFALGGVSVLKECGCDTVMFGSECGDINTLLETADILESDAFKIELAKELKNGITFAAARQKAAEKCGAKKDILKGANNNLGIEYIIAAKRLLWDVKFETVKRLGAAHDSKNETEFVSSSYLREVLETDFERAKKYLPNETHGIYQDQNYGDIKLLESAVLTSLRQKEKADLQRLPDLSEGVENKLYEVSRKAATLNELYSGIKVKRYTSARIRRLVLSAFLGIDNRFFLKPVPFLQILGMSKSGQALLKKIVKETRVPVILRAKDTENLSGDAKGAFKIETKATDIYMLSLKKPLPCGKEYTAKIIKTE